MPAAGDAGGAGRGRGEGGVAAADQADPEGGWFTRKHRFPDVLMVCVQYHHTPCSEISDEFNNAVKIIHLADQLCKLQGIGWAGGNICSEGLEDTCNQVGLTDEARKRVTEGLMAEVAATKEFYGIGTTPSD